MDRTTARAYAMKLVYEWEMGGEGGEETRLNLLEIATDEPESGFMNRLFDGVVERREEIDRHITDFAKGWSIDRIEPVDLAILRVGVFELLDKKVAPGIAINEAVELAKKYSNDRSGSFINGVLGNISRSL